MGASKSWAFVSGEIWRCKYEKNTYESALRTRCAERTRAKQLAACVHHYTCTVLFMGICVQRDMEVQV